MNMKGYKYTWSMANGDNSKVLMHECNIKTTTNHGPSEKLESKFTQWPMTELPMPN